MDIIPQNIKIIGGGGRPTARAGHLLLKDLLDHCDVLGLAQDCLPPPGSGRGYPQHVILSVLIHLIMGGGIRLADVRDLGRDGLFVTAKLPVAGTLANWLRRFGDFGLDGLAQVNRHVIAQMEMPALVVVDIDESFIPGEKLESEMSYLGRFGFMASVVFVDGPDVLLVERVSLGNFTPGMLPDELLTQAQLSLPAGTRIGLVRSDSAGYRRKLMVWCRANNADFLVAARRDQAVRECADAIAERDWRPFTDLDGSRFEVADTEHSFRNSDTHFQLILFRKVGRGYLPNMSGHRLVMVFATSLSGSPEQVLSIYRRRGEAENRIKDWKSGAATEHMPCSKLSGNRAWCRIAAICYNLHILLSRTLFPTKRHQMQTMRWKVLQIPGTLIRHGRSWSMRVSDDYAEEMAAWRDAILKLPRD